MNCTKKWFQSLLCILGLVVMVAGCATSSHRSTTVREYNDEPQPEKRSESDELDSDWKMQGEGEMVAPGD